MWIIQNTNIVNGNKLGNKLIWLATSRKSERKDLQTRHVNIDDDAQHTVKCNSIVSCGFSQLPNVEITLNETLNY